MRRSRKWCLEVIRELPKPCVKRVAYGLNTVNYGRFLAGILDSVDALGYRIVSLRDINNNLYNVTVKSGIVTFGIEPNPIWQLTGGSNTAGSMRLIARLGNGLTSPNRNSTNLQSPVAGDIVLSGSYTDGDVVTLVW